MEKSLGQQTTIDYYDCDPEIINKATTIKKILEKAANIMNLTIVNTTIHEFSPIGVSGVIVIKESHIAIHTWPEHKYVALDFFTCNHTSDLKEGILWLKEQFKAKRIEEQSSNRGFLKKMNV